MIEPYGSPCLLPLYQPDDRTRIELEREAVRLPSLVISSAAAASAVMLGAGYFTPLKGYMGLADITRVARAMQTAGGLMWPVPVANIVPADQLTPEVRPGARIALLDPNVPGNPVLAIQQVEAIEPLTAEAQGEMAPHSLVQELPAGSDDARLPPWQGRLPVPVRHSGAPDAVRRHAAAT